MWCEVCVVCVAICYQGVCAGPYMSPAALLALALFHNFLPLSIFCLSLSVALTRDSNESFGGGCRFLSGFLLGLGVAPPLVTCISPSHITLVPMSACSVSVCSSSPLTVPAIAPSSPPSVSSPSGSPSGYSSMLASHASLSDWPSSMVTLLSRSTGRNMHWVRRFRCTTLSASPFSRRTTCTGELGCYFTTTYGRDSHWSPNFCLPLVP